MVANTINVKNIIIITIIMTTTIIIVIIIIIIIIIITITIHNQTKYRIAGLGAKLV